MSDVSGDAGSPAAGQFDIDHWYAARDALKRLYGGIPDHNFSALMGDIARRVAEASAARRAELRARDKRRRAEDGFARPGRPVYSAYADRFGGTPKGCIAHIPYLQDLGVGLFHLMLPPGAPVADAELRLLAGALRRADIGLVMDMACDNTPVGPDAFVARLDTFLDLANIGADGFCLGAASPPVRDAVSAWRHLTAMVAPGVFLLAEAPDYDLVYNTPAMAALWAAIAEGNGAIFDDTLRAAPGSGLRLNYARGRDDIAWDVLGASADAARQRQWTRFYAGGESFADGLAFRTAGGRASVCGMASSLCGVADDAFGLDRLKLVYSVVYALDGVPMIHMGDEIALTNETGTNGADADVRGLHRPKMDWDAAHAADADVTPQGEMFAHLRMLGEILAAVPGLAEAGPATPLPGRDGAILAFARTLPKGRFLCLANLSDENQMVRLLKPATDLFDGLRLAGSTTIPPWQVLWLHEI